MQPRRMTPGPHMRSHYHRLNKILAALRQNRPHGRSTRLPKLQSIVRTCRIARTYKPLATLRLRNRARVLAARRNNPLLMCQR